MRLTRFWNNFHQVAQYRRIRKPNKLNVFGCNKTKGSVHDSQNQTRPPMELAIKQLSDVSPIQTMSVRALSACRTT